MDSARSFLADRLFFKLGNRHVLVSFREIMWAQAAGNYLHVHTTGNRYVVRASMAAFEERFRQPGLLRIHRSRLVNLEHVQAIEKRKFGDFLVHLKNGEELKGSRSYRGDIDRLLENNFGHVAPRPRAQRRPGNSATTPAPMPFESGAAAGAVLRR